MNFEFRKERKFLERTGAVSYTHLDVYKRQDLVLTQAIRNLVDGCIRSSFESSGFSCILLALPNKWQTM